MHAFTDANGFRDRVNPADAANWAEIRINQTCKRDGTGAHLRGLSEWSLFFLSSMAFVSATKACAFDCGFIPASQLECFPMDPKRRLFRHEPC